MVNSPLVTVIVPVYEVEQYIERCAKSLFEQTLPELEYIFIDDCSPDNSIRILIDVLNRYPNRIKQTRIVRMPKNSGQAAVRKYGIQLATGKYIIHCDSDDWVDKKAYQVLYDYAESMKADMVFHDYYLSNGIFTKGVVTNIHRFTKSELLKSIITGNVKGSLWLVLVRKELYLSESFRFPKANMTEDSTMIIQLLFLSNKFAYIPEKLYYYCINENSISRSMSKNKCEQRFIDCISNTKLLETFFLDTQIFDYEEEFTIKKVDNISHLLPCVHKIYYYNLWKSTYPDLFAKVYKNKGLSLIKKVKFYITYFRLYPIWHWLCRYPFANN